jgi:hypothetical protein
MKVSTILAGLTLATTTAIAVTPASADIIDRRQSNQASRIEQGIRSGQLTRAEAAKLKAEQARIAAMERAAERDGRVTRSEKARIQAAQNAASRHIYQEKNDAQSRNRFWNRWSLGRNSHDNDRRRSWFWWNR